MDTILLTGGTGALGQTVAHALIEAGYRCLVPYATSRHAGILRDSIESRRRDRLILLETDLLQESGYAVITDTIERHGGLYGLVHLLGGIGAFARVSSTSTEGWDHLMNLNLRSFFLAARLAMKRFEAARRGRIVSIGAMAGIKASATQGAYGVAKSGIVALTKILADEGRTCNVTANCIAPGIVRTAANLKWAEDGEDRDWTSPGDIAAMIVYLLGDAAKDVNGTVIQMFGRLNV